MKEMKRKNTNTIDIYRELKLQAKNKYNKNLTEFSLYSHKKLFFTCFVCGNTYESLVCDKTKTDNKISCRYCSMETIEKNVYNILKMTNCVFEYEYTFPDLTSPFSTKRLSYDFAILYFPDYSIPSLLIELDGYLHKNKIYNKENTEKQVIFDKLKEEYANKNNIPFVRFDVTKYNRIDLLEEIYDLVKI